MKSSSKAYFEGISPVQFNVQCHRRSASGVAVLPDGEGDALARKTDLRDALTARAVRARHALVVYAVDRGPGRRACDLAHERRVACVAGVEPQVVALDAEREQVVWANDLDGDVRREIAAGANDGQWTRGWAYWRPQTGDVSWPHERRWRCCVCWTP